MNKDAGAAVDVPRMHSSSDYESGLPLNNSRMGAGKGYIGICYHT